MRWNKVYQVLSVMVLSLFLCTGCGEPDKALVLSGDGTIVKDGNNKVGSTIADDGSGLYVESGTLTDGTSHADTASEKADEEPMIVVYVCGAVQNPGVVELPQDSRAADALKAAGGLLETAQADYVNLAAKLEDAQKLYFPTKEEAVELVREEAAATNGLVNINTAGIEQLCTLPGIGESRAKDIVAYREKIGAFQNKEDIMKVSGIKQSAYDKLKEYIIVE